MAIERSRLRSASEDLALACLRGPVLEDTSREARPAGVECRPARQGYQSRPLLSMIALTLGWTPFLSIEKSPRSHFEVASSDGCSSSSSQSRFSFIEDGI